MDMAKTLRDHEGFVAARDGAGNAERAGILPEDDFLPLEDTSGKLDARLVSFVPSGDGWASVIKDAVA